MRGSKVLGAMMVVVDRLVNAWEKVNGFDRTIETTVDMMGQFNGKDVSTYLEAYKAEMLMRDIPEDMRLSGFP